MWGPFRARCPLETWEQTWLEVRMRWLADRLGIDRLLKANVLLPTADHFPEPYRGSEADAHRIMDRICGIMELDPRRLDLEICDDCQLPGAAALYDRSETERSVIRIARSVLVDPQTLVATLAHELSHELLLGRQLHSVDDRDHEWVTDVLPVYFGLGVFSANVTISDRFAYHGNLLPTHSLHQHGYLPSRMFGYALALFAFMRGEDDPEWAHHLRPDAESYLSRGLRYLSRGGESLFHPDTVRTRRYPRPSRELIRTLTEGSAPTRLATLWEIVEHGSRDPSLVPAIERCLTDHDPAIPSEAALALAEFGPLADSAVPGLLAALSAPNEITRACSAYTLGVVQARPDDGIPALAERLHDPSLQVVDAAATALRSFGPDAEPAADRLLGALRAALVDCHHGLIENLSETLQAITADAPERVRNYFLEDDHDLQQLALEALASSGENREGPAVRRSPST